MVNWSTRSSTRNIQAVVSPFLDLASFLRDYDEKPVKGKLKFYFFWQLNLCSVLRINAAVPCWDSLSCLFSKWCAQDFWLFVEWLVGGYGTDNKGSLVAPREALYFRKTNYVQFDLTDWSSRTFLEENL